MGYKVFDYKCPSCSFAEERFVDSNEIDNQRCSVCLASMDRAINSSGMYHIRGDNSASTAPRSKVKRGKTK